MSALTLSHVLSDDVNGLLGDDSVKLHQLLVAEFLHHLRFLQEGLGRHSARLQSLDGHAGRAIPSA